MTKKESNKKAQKGQRSDKKIFLWRDSPLTWRKDRQDILEVMGSAWLEDLEKRHGKLKDLIKEEKW